MTEITKTASPAQSTTRHVSNGAPPSTLGAPVGGSCVRGRLGADLGSRLVCVAVVMVAVVTMAPVARANERAVDASFGRAGEVTFDFPGIDRPTAMVRTASGDIAAAVVAGGGVRVVMLTPDGRLDTTFAGSGVKDMGAGFGASAAGLAATRDGASPSTTRASSR